MLNHVAKRTAPTLPIGSAAGDVDAVDRAGGGPRRCIGADGRRGRVPQRAEQRIELVGRQRHRQTEALAVVAPERSQRYELFVGLDALGDRRQLEAVREVDDPTVSATVSGLSKSRMKVRSSLMTSIGNARGSSTTSTRCRSRRARYGCRDASGRAGGRGSTDGRRGSRSR